MNTSNNSNETATVEEGSTAVVFFSCTGTTEAVAKQIATATGGTLMQINPAVPYTSADLDYESDCRANTEQNTPETRPELANPIPDVSSYEIVYLGYPIWWGTAPRCVLSFIDSANLAGKTVIPFCTSGSSSISASLSELEDAAPAANWLSGERFSRSTTQETIDEWVAQNN